MFEETPQLQTLLGIEDETTELDIRQKAVECGQAKVLAAEIKAARAASRLAKLDVAMNDIGVCGGQALADVIPSSTLQSIVVGPKATRIKSSSLPTEREYTLALNLALQAHCVSTISSR